MPTSATHITVVEQLALRDPQLRLILGDPTAGPDTAARAKMCFSKFGSVGPDVLYLLGDFNKTPASALQDLENFLVKVGGTVACITDLSERINKWLDGVLDGITLGIATELDRKSKLINGIVNDLFLGLLVHNAVNVWANFRSPRQQDFRRPNWFWADYLHYVRTGDFVKQLVANAKATKDEELIAYAFGYLTHYVTDVVGHPYVNQVVQGPYRMHWQRHHLVENFIDAYVWNRWHVQSPDPGGSEERPLDAPIFQPNPPEEGDAPLLTARLHDHVTIGTFAIDPVDRIVRGVCAKIEAGLFDIGVLEEISIGAPAGDGLNKWSKLFVKTMRDIHAADVNHPTILASPPNPRPEGFPLEDDLKGAYGVLRLLLKISTEEEVDAPVFPDIAGDITKVIEDTMQKVADDIGGIPPVPIPNSDGAFSLDALIQALADAVQWAGEVLEGIAKAVVDIFAGLAAGTVVAVADGIKAVLWLLNSALFALYRCFRDLLMLNAYSAPFTDQLFDHVGPVNTSDLWISKGNLEKMYPAEEKVHARDVIFSPYHPYVAPAEPKDVELPNIQITAPYAPNSRPEAFLENRARGGFLQRPPGTDNMFSKDGPQAEIDIPGGKTFTTTEKNFGPAIPNCAEAIRTLGVAQKNMILPNYDMDGDRGYAWPGWETSDPLDPTKVDPVTVHVVRI